jgi:VWFA-related protein
MAATVFTLSQRTQAQSPIPTIRAETRVVQIEVSARDAHKRPVTNLTEKDFIVTDQGKPRTIDIFSVDNNQNNIGLLNASQNANQPAATGSQPQRSQPGVFSNRNAAPEPATHSTVILLDHVNIAEYAITAMERQGVLDLLSKVNPDERIALYVIGKLEGVVLLQGYTTNRALLLKSMRDYIPRYMSSTPSDFPQPEPAKTDGDRPPAPPVKALTVEDTAEDVRLALQSLAEHLALIPGRKSIFWISQGFSPRQMHGPAWEPKDDSFDPSSGWAKTLATLNEADVAVNAIDANPKARIPERGVALLMKQIAEATGGQGYFGGSNEIGAELAEGIEESHATYTLGFYLAEDDRDDKFHDLKIQTTRPGLQLSHRQGYYAGATDLAVSKPEKDERLETVLLNQVDSHDIGITARAEATPGTPRGTINIKMNLDTRTLFLQERGAAWSGKVDEMFIELNDAGRTLAKISDTKDFEFAGASREQYASEGITWPISIPLVPGAAKLAIIVRDKTTGRVGSLTVPLAKQ